MKRLYLLSVLASIVFSKLTGQTFYSVLDYGAKGDGQANETQAIQATIDKAAEKGGGIVLFPPGKYVSGSIVLKDYIVLRFETGSILQGSLDLEDYPDSLGILILNEPYVWRGPLIYAEGARYIGIEGHGIIDGRGTRENFPPFPRERKRPGLIRFKDCQFVSVKDVTMRNSACWTFHLKNCEEVVVRDIYLNSNTNRNNDGIDIDGGKRISITGCNINSEDDAIVFKSFTRESVRDIVISDCILTSTCSAIKIGTETVGTFENISISNCVIYKSRGINLFSVDGSDINNVTISNVSMRDSKAAIQLRLGQRMRPYNLAKDQQFAHAGRIRNIMISNVQAVIGEDHASTGVDNSQNFIAGIPGHPIENVTLSNVQISLYGNGTAKQARRDIPEEIRAYPKIGMFGELPAYGFYVRHVKGISLNNVKFEVMNPDYRPAIIFDEVSDMEVSDCTMEAYRSSEPVISLVNTENVIIKHNKLKGSNNTFLGVSGKKSRGIILKDNFLMNTKTTFHLAKDVKAEIVHEIGTIR